MRAEEKPAFDRRRSLSDEFDGALAILEGAAPYIRAARGFLDITQKELADQAGVGVSTVSRIESGKPIWRRDRSALSAILRLLENEGVECVQPNPQTMLRGGVRFWAPTSDVVCNATLRRLATGACMKFPSERERMWTSLDLSQAKSLLDGDEG